MSNLIINGVDVSHLVKGLRVGYETLVSEDSGRNAHGDTVLDIINRKVKLYVTFRPMDGGSMKLLLSAMRPYVINVSFRNPETGAPTTINCYHGTPEPEYYWTAGDNVLYREFQVNYIEM